MKKIKKLIAQISRKQITKLLMVFLIFGFVFVATTYAEDSASKVNTISYYIHLLLSILSWIWIILANLAGKMMTNDVLYGWFLNLDKYLWILWNMMKNFANFALWFMVLFAIVRNIVSTVWKDAGEWAPVKVIQKTLIAGVLIQSSWFLMGAVVDLSTIMTSAIWAFPSQFIASNQTFQWHMTNNLWKLGQNKIVFNPKSENQIITLEPKEDSITDEDDVKTLLDTITPGYDSVSGPLLFLGLSVFNFNEYESFGGAGNDSTWITEWGDLFLSLWLSWAILIFFTLMMFFIFLFNLFRLIMLWIIIPLLPIILLLKIFKLTDKLKGGGSDLSAMLDVKNVFMLVFKPVIMVWALSLILVMSVIIKSVIAWDKTKQLKFEDQWNVVIESYKEWDNTYTSTMKSDGIFNISMTGVKDTFADIIVYAFGLFLMFFLVKMSVTSTKTGIKFIDDSLDKTFKSFQNTLTSLPIIPLPGWWAVGISALKKGLSSSNIEGAATRLAGINVADQTSKVSKFLWLGDTFDGLDTTLKREEWVAMAVSAGRGAGITEISSLIGRVADKMNEWNIAHPSSKRITSKQLENVRKNKPIDEGTP